MWLAQWMDAAELAQQHQAVADEGLRIFIAPTAQALDDQHTEHDLNRGGGPAAPGRQGMPLGQVSRELLEERVIVEKTVEVSQDRVEDETEVWDGCEEVGRRVGMARH